MRALGAGSALAAGGALAACAPQGARPAGTVIRAATAGFNPDVELSLRAAPASAPILPGRATSVWSYQARLIAGPPSSLATLPDTSLGPILRARTGQRIRIHFQNDLPAGHPSIVHWHGLTVPDDMDGHPRHAIEPGQSYVYEFEVVDRAGSYWFHPHPHEQTAVQVYNGLAGLFLVSDAEEESAGLPGGDFDIPLVLQDRVFGSGNELVYTGGAPSVPAAAAPAGGMAGHNMPGMRHSMGGAEPAVPAAMMGGMQGMMDQMMGFLGARILVNGRPDFTLSAATRVYRLRLLNASNARIYKLAWSSGVPLTLIGADGGLLEKPVEKPYLVLGPGERAELWADFSGMKVGSEFTLQSQPFEGADDHGGMMGGMAMGDAPPQGAPLTLFRVRIARAEKETLTLPRALSSIPRLAASQAVNAASPREIGLTLNGMQWLINNRAFEMEAVAADEQVRLGSTEVWEIVNKLNPGQMMDANGMAHPIHIHGGQFQVLGRDVLPQLRAGWETVRDGYLDEGWKDTVLVMPGERVRIAKRFDRYAGLYAYHCHNLEHESAGMMRNYRVA